MFNFWRKGKAEKSKSVQVAESIAEVFANGEIASHDLDPGGISKLAILWNGADVVISWYPPGCFNVFRSLEIDGVNFPSGNNKAENIMLSAAMIRARSLLSDTLGELHDKIK